MPVTHTRAMEKEFSNALGNIFTSYCVTFLLSSTRSDNENAVKSHPWHCPITTHILKYKLCESLRKRKHFNDKAREFVVILFIDSLAGLKTGAFYNCLTLRISGVLFQSGNNLIATQILELPWVILMKWGDSRKTYLKLDNFSLAKGIKVSKAHQFSF